VNLLGVLRRLLRCAGEEHAVAGDHVDHLFAGLVDLDQELAQRRIARQRRDSFLCQSGSGVPPLFLGRLQITRTIGASMGSDILPELFHTGGAADDVVEGFFLPDGEAFLGRRRDASATLDTLGFTLL